LLKLIDMKVEIWWRREYKRRSRKFKEKSEGRRREEKKKHRRRWEWRSNCWGLAPVPSHFLVKTSPFTALVSV